MVAQDLPPDEFFWASRPYLPEIAAVNAIRVQSNLVEVPTLVLDSKDKPVGNLKKDDFLLFDNGKPQTISIFSVFTEPAAPTTPPPGAAPSAPPPVQPRYVALFFDDVSIDRLARSAFTNLNMGRDGAIKYIRKGLAPGERVGIFPLRAQSHSILRTTLKSCSTHLQDSSSSRESRIRSRMHVR